VNRVRDDLSSFGLEGQKALVTGASHGIGRALALGLARAGTDVALVSRTRSKLEEVAAEIKAMGRRGLVVPADISDLAQITRMVDEVHETFRRIDILVNNAAGRSVAPALEVTEEQWDQTVGTSLKGLFFVSQATARLMVRQGRGKIINIGSTLGEVVMAGRAVYATAKGGVHQLTRALAYEWARHGIYVNAVAPCITETPTRREVFEQPGYEEWITKEMIPLGRWAQPNDLLGAVLFLASPLSDMVVGHVLMVDGGWTIH
jgi:NAD(P)-dependent dehydrogenase (short-subunit alcohol dehydrogenase family)